MAFNLIVASNGHLINYFNANIYQSNVDYFVVENDFCLIYFQTLQKEFYTVLHRVSVYKGHPYTLNTNLTGITTGPTSA